MAKELRHSRNELSNALKAVRRAAREREGLVRFLCHELRSPLNCIALGFDELATGNRAAPDAETVSIVRNQIQNMHNCLDDIMLVVGSQAPSAPSASSTSSPASPQGNFHALTRSPSASAERGHGASSRPESPSVIFGIDAAIDIERGIEMSRSTAVRGQQLQPLSASSLARLLHAVAHLTEIRKPRLRRGAASADQSDQTGLDDTVNTASGYPAVSVTVSRLHALTTSCI